MLFLAHCTFEEKSDEPLHGYFTFLVDAANFDSARESLRDEISRMRQSTDIFDESVEIYLDNIIEVTKLPKRGLIGRYEAFSGQRRGSVSCSIPNSNSPHCVCHEPGDTESDDGEGVSVEPFVMFGAKQS